MENLKVYGDGLSQMAQKMQEEAKALQSLSDHIQFIRTTLPFQVRQRAYIDRRLSALGDEVFENAQDLFLCAACLQQAADQYMACERKLAELDATAPNTPT